MGSGNDLCHVALYKINEGAEQKQLSLKEIWRGGQHDLIMRWQRVLEEQRGYSSVPEDNPDATRYFGNPGKHYMRYRFTSLNRISLGFTAERDAGENWLAPNQGFFDFWSGHAFYAGKGFLKSAALGDYQMQFGQGLAAWSGLGFGKSAYVMNVKRTGRGIRPYTSVDENRFFRGAAVTVGGKRLEGTVFYSNKRIDANLQELDTLDQIQLASSFFGSGFHRTPGELDNKDAVREQVLGGRLGWKEERWGIGLNHIQSNYDKPLQPADRIYNRFAFAGDENQVTSLDFFALVKSTHFFGEVAQSQSGGRGTLAGMLLPMHPKLNLSAMARHYDRNFQSTFGSAFGEASTPINETGLYIGMELKPAQKWTLNLYFDQFEFDWLRFRQDAPGSGNDKLAQLNYRKSRNAEYYIRVRHRNRLRNLPSELGNIDAVGDVATTQVRVNAQYSVSQAVRFKSRVEWSEVDKTSQAQEHGWLLSQDVIVKPLGSSYSFALRYALFDTDGFDSRIYSYENDLLYTYSIPAYFNRGSRVYGMVKWRLWRKTDLWLRYSRWFYEDRETISSGLNEIDGNTKSEVKAQLRIRF